MRGGGRIQGDDALGEDQETEGGEKKKGKEGTEKNWLQVTGLRVLLHARYRDHPARNFALANF